MSAQPKTSFLKKIIACVCALAFVTSLLPVAALAAPQEQETEDAALVAQGQGSPNVTYRSERDIKNYYRTHNIDLKQAPKFNTAPQTTNPYKPGEVNQVSLAQALTTLNFIRYVAGLDEHVVIDNNYSAEAQAAALVNAANGSVNKYPTQPAGMSVDLYNQALEGAHNSNLYASAQPGNINAALLAWLDDSDEPNISTLSHRRMLLNPYMGRTGFGVVDDAATKGGFKGHVAMYTNNDSNSRAPQNNVAWPAENTPMELFGSNDAWSLSTNAQLDASKVKVTLTRNSDNKTWNFSQAGSDGDFYVNNDNYGQKGCVIFRPKDLTIGVGSGTNDYYRVSVTGIPNPVDYQVSFFGLSDEITSVTLPQTEYEYTGSEIKPKPTVKYYDRVLTQGKDYEVVYTNNVNEGTATVKVTGIGTYTGALSTSFKIVPSTGGSGDGGNKGPQPSDPKGTPVVMYRLYNPNSGEHFYTASEYERAYLISIGWNNEDVGWIAPSEGDPVYRLYNSYGGEHHYTLSTVERDHLISVGWNDEGIGWYSGGRTPLYRQYNPNAYANNHNYTTSEVERDNVLGAGWHDEGIGWYGIE
ncbi:MAG: CAP domain-containing protein [Coriobacteriales bacterium]